MTNDRSPSARDVIAHYASGYEEERLALNVGKLECERTRQLMARLLPPPPALVLDAGGGPGAHGCWLAARGYEVHLVDIVPLHVEMALQASAAQPQWPLASASVGDARSLPWDTASFDSALLFGPLYHLTNRQDRIGALREAARVLRPGGTLLAVGISRFASALDGLKRGFLADSAFAEIVLRDLEDGQHGNPTGNPEYFTDTFFHHPSELETEIVEAGFEVNALYAIEGPSWLAADFDCWWEDEELKSRLLEVVEALETESCLIGASPHLMGYAVKP